MNKRKSPKGSKNPSNRKMAANAKLATVKSPKRPPAASPEDQSALTPVSELELSVIEGPDTTTSEDHQTLSEKENERLGESQNDRDVTLAVERSTASAPTHPSTEREVPVVDISEPSQRERRLSDREANGFDAFSAAAPIQAYQAKLFEIYSTNIQLAFEFAARLLTVASPVELFAVTSEFTSKGLTMFLKQSEQATELLVRRSSAW
jgi:hypothetical protein